MNMCLTRLIVNINVVIYIHGKVKMSGSFQRIAWIILYTYKGRKGFASIESVLFNRNYLSIWHGYSGLDREHKDDLDTIPILWEDPAHRGGEKQMNTYKRYKQSLHSIGSWGC